MIDLDKIIDELKLHMLIGRVNDIIYSDNTWEDKFHLIFSPSISGEIDHLCRKLNFKADYYDPDTSYKEDVLAYMTRMNEVNNKIKSLLKQYLDD